MRLKENFLNPGSEFSPIPFWFWNGDLKESEIISQIHSFKEKGVDGFVIHPRMGIPKSIEYLSDNFMFLVLAAVKEAARLDMKVILYDEAMYPSGSAHGMVVMHNPKFASRGLQMTVSDKKSDLQLEPDDKLIAEFTKDNKYYSFVETYSKGHIRGIHFGEDDEDLSRPPSADLLNEDAVALFINYTHDTYYTWLKEYFGSTIIAFFTDEPSIMGRGHKKGLIPWSEGLLDEFLTAGGKEELLPELWEDGSEARKLFDEVVLKRMERTFYKPISDWCANHGISFIGHPAKSDDIGLLKYFHIPGQDLVLRTFSPECKNGLDGEHSTQAKCSSDSARHLGKRRNVNECFGACNRDNIDWYFTADDMKWYTDWLAVRGVNMFIPHAFYYSVEGPRKEERPPDVGPNNLWWKHFDAISMYMKRLSYIQTDCYNTTKLAVLCGEDSLPHDLVKPLYQNQIEFNYLQKSLIEDGTAKIGADGTITIGKQVYTAVIAEDDFDIPEEIRTFNAYGGKLFRSDYDIDKLPHEIKIETYQPDLRFSHIIKDGADIYIFSNEGEEAIDTKVYIGEGGACEIWDAWSTSFTPCVIDECGKAELKLNRRELLLYVVSDMLDEAKPAEPEKLCVIYEETLNNGWKMNGKPIDKFISWVDIDEMKDFSGEASYSCSFELKERGKKVTLSISDVHYTTEVYVNSKSAGFRLWAPHDYDITDFIKTGTNTIEIKVCNCMANKMSGAALDGGILGHVKIRVEG